MAYWGHQPAECDRSFDFLTFLMSLVWKQIEKEIRNLESLPKEQTLLMGVRSMRLLAREAPRTTQVIFGRKKLGICKDAFYEWASKAKIPSKYKSEILRIAEEEFQMFEDEVYAMIGK